eukprot:GHVH01010066.1.p1 GENE.GHVH01010066.1~~GHVH01010066.1.p1  ORF type:complete len:876 (-),score=122.17 GHVH01010066.1:2845-5472(-)
MKHEEDRSERGGLMGPRAPEETLAPRVHVQHILKLEQPYSLPPFSATLPVHLQDDREAFQTSCNLAEFIRHHYEGMMEGRLLDIKSLVVYRHAFSDSNALSSHIPTGIELLKKCIQTNVPNCTPKLAKRRTLFQAKLPLLSGLKRHLLRHSVDSFVDLDPSAPYSILKKSAVKEYNNVDKISNFIKRKHHIYNKKSLQADSEALGPDLLEDSLVKLVVHQLNIEHLRSLRWFNKASVQSLRRSCPSLTNRQFDRIHGLIFSRLTSQCKISSKKMKDFLSFLKKRKIESMGDTGKKHAGVFIVNSDETRLPSSPLLPSPIPHLVGYRPMASAPVKMSQAIDFHSGGPNDFKHFDEFCQTAYLYTEDIERVVERSEYIKQQTGHSLTHEQLYEISMQDGNWEENLRKVCEMELGIEGSPSKPTLETGMIHSRPDGPAPHVIAIGENEGTASESALWLLRKCKIETLKSDTGSEYKDAVGPPTLEESEPYNQPRKTIEGRRLTHLAKVDVPSQATVMVADLAAFCTEHMPNWNVRYDPTVSPFMVLERWGGPSEFLSRCWNDFPSSKAEPPHRAQDDPADDDPRIEADDEGNRQESYQYKRLRYAEENPISFIGSYTSARHFDMLRGLPPRPGRLACGSPSKRWRRLPQLKRYFWDACYVDDTLRCNPIVPTEVFSNDSRPTTAGSSTDESDVGDSDWASEAPVIQDRTLLLKLRHLQTMRNLKPSLQSTDHLTTLQYHAEHIKFQEDQLRPYAVLHAQKIFNPASNEEAPCPSPREVIDTPVTALSLAVTLVIAPKDIILKSGVNIPAESIDVAWHFLFPLIRKFCCFNDVTVDVLHQIKRQDGSRSARSPSSELGRSEASYLAWAREEAKRESGMK